MDVSAQTVGRRRTWLADLSATILQLAACALVSAAVFFLIVRWKRT
jgi:hypothetical protein